MRILISEKLSDHKYKTSEGYLVCADSILARTGKQQYKENELFTDGTDSIIDVDRPYEEVFSKLTLASFENKPLTIDHPEESVNVGNFKDYAVGFVRDIKESKTDKGESIITGNLVVTDQEAINLIESGEYKELSCGYDCDILKDDKNNYYQHNIRGNHVALCKEGRAGIAKILDSKIGDYMYNIKSILNEALRSINKKFKDLEDDFVYNKVMKYIKENYNSTVLNESYRFLNNYINRHGSYGDSIIDSKIDMQNQDFDEVFENDEEYIISRYDVRVDRKYGRSIITGSRSDLQKLYKDYRLKDYGVRIIDSKIEDTIKGNHKQLMGVIYENDYDLPTFSKTIDLIEKLWQKNYSEYDSWTEFKFNNIELNQIYESAKKEAQNWDNIDIYNSHARYRSNDDINYDLQKLFGIKNKRLKDSNEKLINQRVKDREDKFLSKEAKQLKEELGLYQHNRKKRPDGTNYNKNTGRKQNVNPWNSEITEAMNDALQMIIDGDDIKTATYRLSSAIYRYEDLLDEVSDDDKQKLKRVISRGKSILKKLTNYKKDSKKQTTLKDVLKILEIVEKIHK